MTNDQNEAREPQARTASPAIIALAAWSLVVSSVVAAEPAPVPRAALRTMLPWVMPDGAWEASVGVAYLDDARPAFLGDEPGFVRDVWQANVVDAAVGLGERCEARLWWGVQRIDERGAEPVTGVQDARIRFAFTLPSRGIDWSAGMVVKLPNAPGEDRLGTDETDVAFLVASGWQSSRWGWGANLGFGILGHPVEAGTQDDVLLFALAGWWSSDSSPLRLFAEVEGLAASRFGNDVRTLGAGAVMGRRFPVTVALRSGLTAPSPDWSAEAMVTFVPGRGD